MRYGKKIVRRGTIQYLLTREFSHPAVSPHHSDVVVLDCPPERGTAARHALGLRAARVLHEVDVEVGTLPQHLLEGGLVVLLGRLQKLVVRHLAERLSVFENNGFWKRNKVENLLQKLESFQSTIKMLDFGRLHNILKFFANKLIIKLLQ